VTERERETVYGGYSELAGSRFVSVRIYGLGNFLGTVEILYFDSFWTSPTLMRRMPH